ncbi:MAG: type II toxin-antitoxin system RelE/ParE family toxin [Thermodesulfobacteriota bacterium]|nr:type II toxin-antitoxin system RelE/ParE family toxin [Thermodesulfobacteriota bacterium]
MPRFKRYVKKLPRQFQQVILDAVEDVLADPGVGEHKAGDLEGFTSLQWAAN